MNKQRSNEQNNSLHAMFQAVADEMNATGITTKTVITIVADTYMDKELVKRLIWKPLQEEHVGTKHTAQLTTAEVNKVLTPFTLALGEIGITAYFPNRIDNLHNNQ